MAIAEGPVQTEPSERATKVTVPLIGTAFAFASAVLSGYVLYFTNDKTNGIQERLAQIQRDQFAAEQSAKSSQFNRESARQYVALVYTDLTSKDPSRQRAALSLLEILEPETSLKLLAWAQKTSVILPENKTESRAVEQRLEALQESARFRIFLHVGSAKNRPVPDVDAIKKSLAGRGFSILGVDDKSDEFGPGVDYFNEGDKAGAEKAAATLGELLPGGPAGMRARKQSAPNRAGTLGIWF